MVHYHANSKNKAESKRQPKSRRSGGQASFKVGRVHVYQRGQAWYVRYHERGRRIQKRVGPARAEAKKLAAELNSQLECGVPSVFGFEQIGLPDLRDKWLACHEDIKRSSIATIARYRSATAHLIRYAESTGIKFPSELTTSLVEDFVRFLRRAKVAPNGHANANKRPLRDSGIKFILQTCSNLFNYARRQRHLPPYYESPFVSLEIGHIPVEDSKPTVVFASHEVAQLLVAADDWLTPIVLALLQTGMRPRELTHLLIPDDLDLAGGWIHIRNKRNLGWMVKTRRERSIPIMPCLVEHLKQMIKDRSTGPVFLQRRCDSGYRSPLDGWPLAKIEREFSDQVEKSVLSGGNESARVAKVKVARTFWRTWGAVRYDYLRNQFVKLMKQIGRPDITAVKTCRHNFATCLQDANVDPLIRNELLGHSPSGLGMTTLYTQTRPETKRKQLFAALELCESTRFARNGLDEIG